MSINQVYVFNKPQPSPVAYVAEIRSAQERGSRQVSTLLVKMLSKSSERGVASPVHPCHPPYIKQDIPIVVVFRALGIVADRDILEHICYDFEDAQMLELLKPCIEGSLCYPGTIRRLHWKTWNDGGSTREKRIKYAHDIYKRKCYPMSV